MDSSQEAINKVRELATIQEKFLRGEISSLDHSRLRESLLIDALMAVAASDGARIQRPISIDSRGDIAVMASPDIGSKVPGSVGKFGAAFAQRLNKHSPRTGSAAYGYNAVMEANSGWCHLNHFSVERLVLEAYVQFETQHEEFTVLMRSKTTGGTDTSTLRVWHGQNVREHAERNAQGHGAEVVEIRHADGSVLEDAAEQKDDEQADRRLAPRG